MMRLIVDTTILQLPSWTRDILLQVRPPFPATLPSKLGIVPVTGYEFWGAIPSPSLQRSISHAKGVFLRLKGIEAPNLVIQPVDRFPVPPTVVFDASDPELNRGVNVVSAIRLPIRLTFDDPEAINWEGLETVLERFLHRPDQSSIIHPLDQLMVGALRNLPITLRNIARPSPQPYLFVHRSGRLALTETDREQGRFIGELEKSPDALSAHPLLSQRKEFHQRVFLESLPCAECSYYRICGGFMASEGVTHCAPSFAFFDRIQDQARALREQLSRIDQTPPRPPRAVSVLVSYKCTNDCVFCAPANLRKHHEEDPDAIIATLQDARQKALNSVVLSGAGEPALSDHIDRYLEEIRTLGFTKVSLFTNGSGFSKYSVQEWKDKGVTNVLVSIHGLEETHDHLSNRGGAFAQAWETLEQLADSSMEVTVNTCLVRRNLDELTELVTQVEKTGRTQHSLTVPEWDGNVIVNREEMATYSEIHRALQTIPVTKGLRFHNLPDCIGPANLPRMHPGAVLHHDASGTRDVDSTSLYNRYPKSCRDDRCIRLGLCSGVDRRYLEIRGAGEFSGRALR